MLLVPSDPKPTLVTAGAASARANARLNSYNAGTSRIAKSLMHFALYRSINAQSTLTSVAPT